MPTTTIADTRRQLEQLIVELDHYRKHPDPSEPLFCRCAQIGREGGDLLARRGFSDLYRESRFFREYAAPDDTKAFLVACLAAVDSLPRVSDPPPPIFNATEAADFSGLTKGQLYSEVEAERLIPTGRGPRNSLLFTLERLQDYANE